MKFALTFLLMSILLSACSDGKENRGDAEIPTTTRRTIATEYQIIKMQTGEQAKCQFSLDGSQPGELFLGSGQHVVLADKKTTTVIKEGTAWLAVLTDDQPGRTCYVETKYLEPVPIN